MNNIAKLLLVPTTIALATGCVQKRNIENEPVEEVNCEEVTTTTHTQTEPVKQTPPPVPPKPEAQKDTQSTHTNTVITEKRTVLREALYVQIFTTKNKDNANRVLNGVKSRFPEDSAVIKTSGQYKVVLGPYEKDKIKAVRDNIATDKDFSTAFIITYFTQFEEPVPTVTKETTVTDKPSNEPAPTKPPMNNDVPDKEAVDNTGKITEENIDDK